MEEKTLWKTVLAELQLTLTPGSFQTLFAKSILVQNKDNVVSIALANAQIKTMVEERYYALLKEILDRLTKKTNSLTFAVTREKEAATVKDLGPLFSQTEKIGEEAQIEQLVQKLHLRTDFTFDNFAVSSSNQLAYAAASAVTKNPGSAYNPLYVWGGVGVGKTHLVHAVAHVLLRKDPKTSLIYCSSEEFTNEMTMAIRNKSTDKFKTKYRNVKALLIDDIQFIAGKDYTQEEFFHTFNAIQREGGQVVLTSDKPPHEIAGLEDRIRSRFEGGLVVDIQPPDLELRTAIAMIKAKQRGFDLPIALAQKIAQNLAEARQLEGFIVRLLNETQGNSSLINEELVSRALGKSQASEPKTSRLEPKRVIAAVCSYYNLKVSDLKGERRKREIVRPRQLLMWLLRSDTELTLQEVGTFLGGRDHTTIMHGCETMEKLVSSSEAIQKDVLGIKQRLAG
ncbi:chromosomal replication initiator protein DnaA [Candidatus Gottesmanbacteria bacterium]|nr:chromosomal replication initiator protein DnaA [Candidatus Gottesmanbacteria bacterium]